MAARRARPERVIDAAPGKRLIQQLVRERSPEILERFFEERLAWCGGYPLIHDFLVTYGAFDDLLAVLTPELCLELLPAALRLANDASDQAFHAALALLADLIPNDRISPRPEGFSQALLVLKLRAERLSFLPNLSCAWDTLALKQRYLVAPGDPLRRYAPQQLALAEDRWQAFFPFPLLNVDRSPMAACQAPLAELRGAIQRLGGQPGERRLIYATRIEDVRYWAWRLPGQSGTAHLARLVFLRQPPVGDLGLGYWDLYRQFSERDSPREISRRLLNIEFRPHDLIPIARRTDFPPTPVGS